MILISSLAQFSPREILSLVAIVYVDKKLVKLVLVNGSL